MQTLFEFIWYNPCCRDIMRFTRQDQRLVFSAVERDERLLDKLESARTQDIRSDCGSSIFLIMQSVAPRAALNLAGNTSLFAGFTNMFFNADQSIRNSYPQLQAALLNRQNHAQIKRDRKRRLLRGIGLDWVEEDRTKFLDRAKIIYVERLKTPYPTLGHHIIDCDGADTKMRSHLESGKLPDKRQARLPILRLDEEKLQLTIGANESVLVCDAETGELVMAILRNFVGQPAVLNWLDGIITEEVKYRKNIRVRSSPYRPYMHLTFMKLEDPGKLVQVGFSTGARSKPSFHWVRNIPSKTVKAETADKLDQDSAAAFSLVWTLLKKKLPPVIISDTEEWIAKTDVPRMSKEVLGENGDIGPIRIYVQDDSFNLHNAELAPPTGVMAQNYAR